MTTNIFHPYAGYAAHGGILNGAKHGIEDGQVHLLWRLIDTSQYVQSIHQTRSTRQYPQRRQTSH